MAAPLVASRLLRTAVEAAKAAGDALDSTWMLPLSFSNSRIEEQYQSERQAFLARQDADASLIITLLSIAWVLRFVGLAGSWSVLQSPELFLPEAIVAVSGSLLFPLPWLMSKWLGAHAYARQRRHILLLKRLLLLGPIMLGQHLLPVASLAEDLVHTLGQLLLSARTVVLLAVPLGFELQPGLTMVMQAVAVAAAMWRLPYACSCRFLQLPSSRASLDRLAYWLGHAPSPFPLPPVDLEPGSTDVGVALAMWLQASGLLVLCPPLHHMVALWDARARREFALALPRGALPATERLWWAGLVLPSMRYLLLLLMPSLSLSVWRITVLALTQQSSRAFGLSFS